MTNSGYTIETITDRARWNDALRTLPYAHILQTWEWGEFKRATTGWQPHRFLYRHGEQVCGLASVGVRRAGMFSVMYAPKGPALAYDDADLLAFALDHLEGFARKKGAIWLKIDPDVIAATGIPNEDDDTPNPTGTGVIETLTRRGWRFSPDQVQFRNTITLDLTQSEDELLAAMSQSTRRKIRIAEREGVSVRSAALDDLPTLYDLYRVTGERDNFLIRPFDYYERAWRDFIAAGLAQPLIADVDGVPVAHVILFHFARTCWYFYGASSDLHRDKMPNYALQWAAIRWAKAQGYTTYDFWGAPDDFVETDRLWGVYNFKRGFRGTVTRHIGAWDYAPTPFLYRLYTDLMPRLMEMLRRRNR